jgi:hypothetical protein
MVSCLSLTKELYTPFQGLTSEQSDSINPFCATYSFVGISYTSYRCDISAYSSLVSLTYYSIPPTNTTKFTLTPTGVPTVAPTAIPSASAPPSHKQGRLVGASAGIAVGSLIGLVSVILGIKWTFAYRKKRKDRGEGRVSPPPPEPKAKQPLQEQDLTTNGTPLSPTNPPPLAEKTASVHRDTSLVSGQ